MCSVVGVPNLVNSKSLMARLMWFISILMSVAFTFYLIMSSIIAYYSYDVVTNIKVVYPSQIDYPAVSFCPFGINNEENMFLIESEFDQKDVKKAIDYKHFVSNEIKCANFNQKNLSSGRELFQMRRSGWKGGLELAFYIHPDESDVGLTSYIYQNDVLPVDYEYQGTPRPNEITNIVVQKSVQKSLGNPFSDCVSINDIASYDSDLVREILKLGYSYTQKHCFEKCRENYCLNCNITGDFDYQKTCSKQCPLECEIVSFTITSMIKNPSSYTGEIEIFKNQAMEHFNLTNMTNDEFTKNLIWIFVYFEEIKYTEITQIPKTTPVDLASSIGGSLGLFLGMSFLSFIQLFEIIYELILLVKQKF